MYLATTTLADTTDATVWLTRQSLRPDFDLAAAVCRMRQLYDLHEQAVELIVLAVIGETEPVAAD